MEIEFNLDEVLKEKNLNIRKASQLCGLTYTTMYGIVKNLHTRVDLVTLSRLSSGLAVDLGKLFREKNKP